MAVRSFAFALLVGFLVSIPARPQTVSAGPTKDSSAVNLLSSAEAALTGGTAISQIALTATVTRTVGPDSDTGTATLKALGGDDSRVDLLLSSGERSTVFSEITSRPPQGAKSGPDGVWHAEPLHNCWIPASWFFPALAIQAALSEPSTGIAYIGPATLNGQAVQHVRFWRTVPAQNATTAALALIQRLSTVDVYLDSSTGLPVAFDFKTHPDNHANVDFQVEIRFSGYQTVGGIRTATHIQKLVNNTPLLDLDITSATANANLSPTDFQVTAQ